MKYAILLLLGCSFLAGCKRPTPLEEQFPQAEPPSPEALRAVVQADNQFACELYQQASKQPGNLVLSPTSLSTALAMTTAGADNGTAQQMHKVLHWNKADDHHAVNAYRLAEWHDATKAGKYELRVANAVWGQANTPWEPAYVQLLAKHYRAGFQQANFGNPDQARGTINRWVGEHTNQKIKELLPANSVTDLTRLVLVNAIDFKGQWKFAFAKEGTEEKARFYTDLAKFVNTPMMYQTHTFNYMNDDDLAMVELPYAGNDLSMVVIRPHNLGALPKLEQSLTAEKLEHWLSKLRATKVNVGLPRFQFHTELKLNEALQALGMTDAFDPAKANFRKMTSEQIYITGVFHQGVIEVNEAGTEASGASGIVHEMKGDDAPRAPPQFHANTPFLYLIRDRKTQSILFIGRVLNPQQ